MFKTKIKSKLNNSKNIYYKERKYTEVTVNVKVCDKRSLFLCEAD